MNAPRAHLPCEPARPGFTLIELLTVIAIIGILAAILIPTVGKVRESARQSACASNVRQLAVAQQLYANENNGRFTVGFDMADGATVIWQARLLPYLSIRQGNNSQLTANQYRTMPGNLYVSPLHTSDERFLAGQALTSYRLNVNLNAWSWWTGGPRWSFRADAPPSPSRVLLLGTCRLDNVDYVMPDWENWGNWSIVDIPGSSQRRFNWAFADGHVQSLTREQLADGSPEGRARWRWW